MEHKTIAGDVICLGYTVDTANTLCMCELFQLDNLKYLEEVDQNKG